MVGLLLRPMHPKLGQAGKNLLHQAGLGIVGRDEFALKAQHPPIDKGRNQAPDEPDYHGRRRELDAVPAHEDKAPKREHRIKYSAHKITADHIFYGLNAAHTAGQFSRGKLMEKLKRQGQEPSPQGRLHGHIQVETDTHNRHCPNHGQCRHGKTGHHHHLRDRHQPFPVQNGQDILKDSFRNNRADQRNKPGKETYQEDCPIVRLPALLKHKAH